MVTQPQAKQSTAVGVAISETQPLIDHTLTQTRCSRRGSRRVSFVRRISEPFDEREEKRHNEVDPDASIWSLVGGLICILVAVTDWVLMSEVIQSSEQNNYNKPFLIRFVVNSCYAVLLLPWICVYALNKRLISNNIILTHWTTPNLSRQSSRAAADLYSDGSARVSFNVSFGNVGHGELVIAHKPKSPKLNKCHAFMSLILVNSVSLCSGFVWYLSLSRTVAAINNTIYQSNCVFVLIYSCFLLKERLSWKKVFAALMAIGGVALIGNASPSSSASSESSVLGIILCVISMTLFALFEVLFKYFGRAYFRFGYELSDTLLYQSCIGLCNLTLFWPMVLLFDHLQIEQFELPADYHQLLNGVLLPSLLDLLFTSALLCGITLCGALFMSLGLILVIPVTFFADIVIFEKASISIVNAYSVIGVCLIVAGFTLLQIHHNDGHREKKNENQI